MGGARRLAQRNRGSRTIVDIEPLVGRSGSIAEYPFISMLFGGRDGGRHAGAGNGRCKEEGPAPSIRGAPGASRYRDRRRRVREPGCCAAVPARAVRKNREAETHCLGSP